MRLQRLPMSCFVIRFLFMACISCLATAGARGQVLQSETIEVVPGHGCTTTTTFLSPGCGPKTTDPDCNNSYSHCKWIMVTIPQTAQIQNVMPMARDQDGVGEWLSCPLHSSGKFMDCTRDAQKIGWMRFLTNSYAIKTDSGGVHVSWQFINWASYSREAKITVYYTFSGGDTIFASEINKPLRVFDVDAYCKRSGSTGALNVDGTGYGWRCTPGNTSMAADEVCRSLYGSFYLAKLTSPPPGKSTDWMCVKRKTQRPFDVGTYCSKRPGFTGAVNLDGTGYGWRCTPRNQSIVADEVCHALYDSSYSAVLVADPPGKKDDWICLGPD
jgi:hypothetical protein